jgi:hypothetical protein
VDRNNGNRSKLDSWAACRRVTTPDNKSVAGEFLFPLEENLKMSLKFIGMERGKMKFEFNGQRVTFLEMAFLAGMNSLLGIPDLVANVIILVPAYTLVAWLVSLTPVGTWVAAGLKLFNISAQVDDLYKLGAAIGFVKGFLVRSAVNQARSQRS